MCQTAGLVWGKELFFDSTKVQANADMDSLTPRFAQAAREHIAQLFAADPAHPDPPVADQPAPPGATAAAGGAEDRGGPLASAQQAEAPDVPFTEAVAPPTTLPFAGTPAQQAQLAAENQAQWKLLAQRRLDPKRPASGSGWYRRITDFRVSTTDADATPLTKSDTGRLGYHDHYAVDGGKARIIVGVLVTPADVQDNQAFLDLLDRARFRFHLHVKRAVADSKYSTGENLRGLALRGIRAYMPLADHEQASPFFKHEDFTHERETDTYRCLQGETLTFRGNSYTTRSRTYAAPAAACAACPLRAKCTDSSKGRVLSRPFDEDYREELRQRQTTEAYKKALRKRQVWVEPLFGEAKEWHQLRRFLLRGLANVNMQGLLVATGQNLKRWVAATTRGHRPTGAQRAALRHSARNRTQRARSTGRTAIFNTLAHLQSTLTIGYELRCWCSSDGRAAYRVLDIRLPSVPPPPGHAVPACRNTASHRRLAILDSFQMAADSAGVTSTHDDTVQRLRAAGLRITAPRLEVLRALTDGPSHTDAYRIAAAVRARTGGISAQTVYNVLASLVAAGLVRRIEPAGGPGLYELRAGDNHHHIVCRRCAATTDVDCVALPAPCLTPADTNGYLIDEAEVTFWGLCPDCRNQVHA